VFSFGIEGDEGSRGVYLMRTLRLFFHIGSVECVTCHSSLNHCMVGFLYSVGAGAFEKVGGRNVMDAMLFRLESATVSGNTKQSLHRDIVGKL
jgi:hypothetical protein